MALKFFTGKLYNNSVAINPDNVIYVAEQVIEGHAVVYCVQSGSIEVADKYLDVVARLNERD